MRIIKNFDSPAFSIVRYKYGKTTCVYSNKEILRDDICFKITPCNDFMPNHVHISEVKNLYNEIINLKKSYKKYKRSKINENIEVGKKMGPYEFKCGHCEDIILDGEKRLLIDNSRFHENCINKFIDCFDINEDIITRGSIEKI